MHLFSENERKVNGALCLVYLTPPQQTQTNIYILTSTIICIPHSTKQQWPRNYDIMSISKVCCLPGANLMSTINA